MKDDGKMAVGGGRSDVERMLGRLVAAPVAAALRGRVLARAEQARRGAALTPGLRKLALACSVAIVAVLFLDPFVGRIEMARLSAVFDGRSHDPAAEALAPELVELLAGDEREANRLTVIQALAASAARADRPTLMIEVRERLKGWLYDEDPEDPD